MKHYDDQCLAFWHYQDSDAKSETNVSLFEFNFTGMNRLFETSMELIKPTLIDR